jgi:hypothetical protein
MRWMTWGCYPDAEQHFANPWVPRSIVKRMPGAPRKMENAMKEPLRRTNKSQKSEPRGWAARDTPIVAQYLMETNRKILVLP